MKESTLYILHIEDNALNAKIFHSIFKRSAIDCEVHLAVNAQEALQHLSVVKYDAILVDLCIPRSSVAIDDPFAKWLTGGDYMREGERIIKYCFDQGIHESSKVIVCSAASAIIADLVKKYGTSLLKLEKPFSSDDLIKMVHSDV